MGRFIHIFYDLGAFVMDKSKKRVRLMEVMLWLAKVRIRLCFAWR